MKEPKAMREIHEIMEKIYEEEKHLTPEERVKKINKESEEFIKKHNLNLKRVARKPVRI